MEKSLRELFEDYVNECRYSAKLRAETIRGYRNVFNLFLKIMPEVTTLELLTPGMLNEFFKRINTRIRIVGRDTLRSGVKNSTIKTQFNKLNVFFIWLQRKSYINSNPLQDIKRPRVTYNDFRRLKDEEIHKIYSAITRCYINSFTLRRDIMMVSLLLYCGLRKGELVALQLRDIDIEKEEITIRGETSKSGNTRILRMHPTLLLHLKDYLKEVKIRDLRTEHLIVSNRDDSGLTYEGLKHWVQALVNKSGIKFHLHQFRHTFACKLAENDTSAFKIQKLMGHIDIRMTMKYERSMRPEDMREDIAKISI